MVSPTSTRFRPKALVGVVKLNCSVPVATLGFWGQRVAMSREPGSPLLYVGGAVVAVLVWNAVIAWRAAAARRS